MRKEGGGPAEGLRILAEGYRQAGHTMEIATLDPPGEATTDVLAPVHALGVKSDGFGFSPHLRPWLRTNAHRFDVTLVDGLWQYHGYAVLRELAGKHPYVVFPHGMLDPWFNKEYRLKHLKKLPYWLLIERFLLNKANRVLFTTDRELTLSGTSFPGARWKSSVIPYGTPGPLGDAADEVGAFRCAVPEIGEESFLLFMGRLHAKKGCDLLLRAYASVHEHVNLPRLVFAGPDSVGWKASLEELSRDLGIQDRVLWPGMLVGPEKWGALRSAEALVLPSHQENFGLVVAEALSCGTPVLISDQVNIHEDIVVENCGLSEPDTMEGTRRLLTRWANTRPSRRAHMRERAVRCWRKHFDSAQTAASIASMCSGVIRHEKSSARHPESKYRMSAHLPT
ncbi:glycosyltransferase [Terriglobus aquaticus]|nr:glycosyltransferase [Terriglobus aquaticus]